MRGTPIACVMGLFVVLAGCSESAADSAEAMAQEPNEGTMSPVELALSAAPAAISGNATVADLEGNVLRAGSNGWTCIPGTDGPAPDPACLDEPWMVFYSAYLAGEEPQIERMGFGYMFEGGFAASLTDPSVTEPAEGEDWKFGPPHVMIVVPDEAWLEGLPTEPNGGPWVMWAGTPFVHVMVPTGEAGS